MTATNPHPLANPFNQSRFRNFGYHNPQQRQFGINKGANPKDLTVPDPIPYNNSTVFQQQSKLTVPNSDIPYYNRPIPNTGFIDKTSLVRLGDGSVLDIEKHKIVFDPNQKWIAKGYWNDPIGDIKKPNANKEWGKTESIESILANAGTLGSSYCDPNLDPISIAYWKKANEESKKLEQNLTDEQKQLLDDLDSGRIFPLSKLIEVNDN